MGLQQILHLLQPSFFINKVLCCIFALANPFGVRDAYRVDTQKLVI